MAKHFPDELKIAKERYPKALADKNDASGPVLIFCSNLLGLHENKVSDVIFEPNIPIRPIYSCCAWFFTDTSEALRNIMLVCGRVDVLWQQHKYELVSSIKISEFLILSMKISEFLSSARTAIDEILLDDSQVGVRSRAPPTLASF